MLTFLVRTKERNRFSIRTVIPSSGICLVHRSASPHAMITPRKDPLGTRFRTLSIFLPSHASPTLLARFPRSPALVATAHGIFWSSKFLLCSLFSLCLPLCFCFPPQDVQRGLRSYAGKKYRYKIDFFLAFLLFNLYTTSKCTQLSPPSRSSPLSVSPLPSPRRRRQTANRTSYNQEIHATRSRKWAE